MDTKKTYKSNAVLTNKCYNHFGICPTLASMYGDKPEDIDVVEFKISENQVVIYNDNTMIADYWGWYDNEHKDFTMIYAKRFLLDMCFPYGIKASEDHNQGKAYRLEIIGAEKLIKSK